MRRNSSNLENCGFFFPLSVYASLENCDLVIHFKPSRNDFAIIFQHKIPTCVCVGGGVCIEHVIVAYKSVLLHGYTMKPELCGTGKMKRLLRAGAGSTQPNLAAINLLQTNPKAVTLHKLLSITIW